MISIKLTKRERLLAALRKQEVDQIPWAPLICGYYTLGLPEPLKGDDIATMRAIGCDILHRYAVTYRPNIEINIPITGLREPKIGTHQIGKVKLQVLWEDEILTRIYETPFGTISDRYIKKDTSPWIMFPKEHKIKTIDDIKPYRYLIDALEFNPTYDYYLEIAREIGDEGIAATSSPVSPFQKLLEIDIGVQNFYILLHNQPKVLNDLMQHMHKKNLEACQVVANSPAEVVFIYDNTSTSYMSPKMFNQYIVDHLNEYSEIIHNGNKLVIIHMCGTLKQITGDIEQGNYDGISDIAPPPTGDIELAGAMREMGKSKVVIGGIDATAFVFLKPPEMKEYVLKILDSLPDYRGVILGSGDAVPSGTPIENLQAITEVVQEYKIR